MKAKYVQEGVDILLTNPWSSKAHGELKKTVAPEQHAPCPRSSARTLLSFTRALTLSLRYSRWLHPWVHTCTHTCIVGQPRLCELSKYLHRSLLP